MKISNKGIDLIKRFEGCELTAYICPAKVLTIGYGHTATVKAGQKISLQQAETLLKTDLESFENAINELVLVPITQSQYDSIVSFVYNVGITAFANSTLLKLLNKKEYAKAGDQFLRWNKANDKVLEGLTNRRNAERSLYYAEKFLK